ncbi:aspartate aminotransferase family protein [Mycobacterium sp. 134]|uniref:aspartate aminotransferase family protein n=1 Tax=Mycobacterium sp. 134 TaxID=3400425 RepID=UPI003AABD47E
MTATTIVTTHTEDLCRAHQGSGKATLGRLLGGMQEVASEGAWLTMSNGGRYLNFGGHGVYLLGHRHPKVVAAVKHQLDNHPMATRVFFDPVAIGAAAALSSVTPHGLDLVHFVNSGAEAAEAAIKLARAHGKTALVTTDRGFHGKTLGALSVTANPKYQLPFEPLLPGVRSVPFGDIESLDAALAQTRGRGCFIVEPVQGEGGVNIPPRGYLQAAAELCARHQALLILDEIQTGLGRLGTWWGADPEAVIPDILLVGKVLSGGVVPVAAMVATARVYEPFGEDPYLHSSTFAASPVACAAAAATVQVLREDGLIEQAATLGTRLMHDLGDLLRNHGLDGRVHLRGRGLLIGMEFNDPMVVGELYLGLVERGVLVNHSLNSSTVLRLTPPAIASDTDLDHFMSAFEHTITDVL